MYILIIGGEEKSHLVPAASTSYTISSLQGNSAYKIQVTPVVGSVEGSPTLVTARTCESDNDKQRQAKAKAKAKGKEFI